MKSAYLILAIPLFALLALSFSLDLGSLLPVYPDLDLTPFLTAQSLGKDFDLAYTRQDSDRFFKSQLYRPAPLLLAQKRIVSSSGEYKNYFVYYYPDLYVFFLTPFVTFFSIHGLLLFHALLIGWIYWMAFDYYKSKLGDPILTAINALVYSSLLLLPVLFLLPSHHLFLFATAMTAIYFGLKRKAILSALLIAISFSSQPWSILLSLLLVGWWETQKNPESSAHMDTARFALVLILFAGAVWGIERLMYPPGNTSEARWMLENQELPLAAVWSTLPVQSTNILNAPHPQKLIDFLFGRSIGFVVYGFVGCAAILSAIWLWRDRIVRTAILFILLFLVSICFSDVSGWNVAAFTDDFSILLCAIPFFLLPVVRPVTQFIAIVGLSGLVAGPLLLNPLGAVTSRTYYVQSFPYRYFPVELSLAGKVGIMKNPAYRLSFAGGTLYFLNDGFYSEENFFWVHGESRVEMLLERYEKSEPLKLLISNGPLENRVRVQFGDMQNEFHLAQNENTTIDLSTYSSQQKEFGGRFYLHGTIESKSGFVPKLFSRDNLDYRYLGCRVQFIQGESIHAP